MVFAVVDGCLQPHSFYPAPAIFSDRPATHKVSTTLTPQARDIKPLATMAGELHHPLKITADSLLIDVNAILVADPAMVAS